MQYTAAAPWGCANIFVLTVMTSDVSRVGPLWHPCHATNQLHFSIGFSYMQEGQTMNKDCSNLECFKATLLLPYLRFFKLTILGCSKPIMEDVI